MPQGQQDAATVTPEGRPLATTIDGVLTRTTPNHIDHRGNVFEIFEGENEFWSSPVVYAYQFSVRPHQMKGWGVHDNKLDRYTIISGEVLLFLWDDREDSPTRGVVQKVVLSDAAVRQVIIPVGVWHLSVNLRDVDAHLINLPTEPYHHSSPDRRLLAWDDPSVPIDLRPHLPQF
jgi:dTDP-4-dehydrorhamnose 3,5-epimerase and related enzymes